MRRYSSKSDKNLEPFKGWKLGNEKTDGSKKFQPYPTDPPNPLSSIPYFREKSVLKNEMTAL